MCCSWRSQVRIAGVKLGPGEIERAIAALATLFDVSRRRRPCTGGLEKEGFGRHASAGQRPTQGGAMS